MFDLCYVFEVQTQLLLVSATVKASEKAWKCWTFRAKKILQKNLMGWLSKSHSKFQNLMVHVNWLWSHSMSLKNLACMIVIDLNYFYTLRIGAGGGYSCPSRHLLLFKSVPVFFPIQWNVKSRHKKNCLVSGNPTSPTFLRPTWNVFGTSENFSSVFRVFWMIFMIFL